MNIYLVGGIVRDKLLGLSTQDTDVDFAVEAPSFNDMIHFLETHYGFVAFDAKPEYGTVRGKVLRSLIGNFDGFIPLPKTQTNVICADFVMCRKDGIYSDHRRPDTVAPGTLADDLARRDFTMNAIAITREGELIDPYHGVRDIEHSIIRCVGDTATRFNEDPLRMLRALRFAITKHMVLVSDIDNKLDTLAPQLQTVAVERKQHELHKMFKHDTLNSIYILCEYPNLLAECFNTNLWLKPTLER
jgi:tRNA nucleotidyltransferase/poly(A) polymerase